jgi:MFS family permease
MIMLSSCNTFLQSRVDDDKRGRVMSFYTMAFMGMAPFGSLLAGGLAEKLGMPWTAALGGAGCLLAAAAFALRLPHLDMDRTLRTDESFDVPVPVRPSRDPGAIVVEDVER